jgi:hypothetical protein
MGGKMKFKQSTFYSFLFMFLFLPFILNAQNSQNKNTEVKTTMPLEKALNPDGTVMAGFNGSFDANGYILKGGKFGEPRFIKKSDAAGNNILGTKYDDNPDDANWDDRFGYSPLSGPVYAIAIDGSDIYVGGYFSRANGISVNNLAKWDGMRWSNVGGGVWIEGGGPTNKKNINSVQDVGPEGNGYVYALIYSAGKLYVGGQFNYVGDGINAPMINSSNVAVWDKSTNTWQSLSTSGGSYSQGSISSLLLKNNYLYVGGYINMGYGASSDNNSNNKSTASSYLKTFLKWDFSTHEWSDLGGNLLNSPVLCLYSGAGSDVIVGGYNYISSIQAAGIAIWDETTGTFNKLPGQTTSLPGPCFAITSDGAGNYYFGGMNSGGYLCKWSYGSDIQFISPDEGFYYFVSTLSYNNGKLYVGLYNNTGGIANNFLMKYDGSSWSTLGSGIDGSVSTILTSGNDVYVGGEFSSAGNKKSPYLAHWYEGSGTTNLSISPAFLSFGDVAIGENTNKTFKVRNTGTLPVTLSGFSIIGTDAAMYKRYSVPDSSSTQITLNPGESYSITLKFTPVSAGYKGAIYQLTYNTGGSTYLLNVTLSGRGIAAKMNLSADNIPFGDSKINEFKYKTLTINNSGVEILTISNLLFSGTNQDMFSFYNGNVMLKVNSKSGNTIQSIAGISTNPINISPGGSVTLTIAFKPATEGAKTANLVIYHNDATVSIPYSIPLTGNGVKTFARISVKTPYIFRPTTGVCYLSAPVDTSIIITNLADNDYLYIKSLQFENNNGVFQLLDNAPMYIAPSKSFELRVRFNPIKRAISTNVLHIINESQNMPDAAIQLSGTVYQPNLVITPDTSLIDFGTTSREVVTTRRSIIIQNLSPFKTITLSGKNISGDTSSYRFIKNNLNISLIPGSVDTIIIEFAPVSSGRKNVTFNLVSDDPLGVNRFITLTGVGGDAPVISASINPIDFGEVDRHIARDTTIALSNIGNLLLNITKISINGDDKDNFSIISGGNPVSLRNGAISNLKIRFYGEIPVGQKNAEIVILCNDPQNPTYKINLTAMIKSKILEMQSRIIFDTLEIGKYQDTITTIKNNGNLSIRITKINFDASHSEDFSFTSVSLPVDLAPGEEKSIKLRFTPKEEGTHYSRLIFSTTDAQNPEVSIVLRGTCIPLRKSVISVIPNPLDFGIVEIDKKKCLSFTIKNAGGSKLIVDSMKIMGDDARHFSISNSTLPLSINSKDTQSVAVCFAPKNDTTRNCGAIIRIYSNDETNAYFDLSLKGSILNQDYLMVYINDTAITSESFEIPIYVSNLTNRNILSYQFTLSFDPEKFNAFEDINKTGSIMSSDWTVLANNKTAGQITIGGFGSTFLSGKGLLLKIKFNIIGSALQKTESINSVIFTSKLRFTDFTFNSGKPSAFTKDGDVYVNRQQTGTFLCGDADVNGQVNAMDASMTLRHAVGLENLSTQGQKNADVDKNSTINVFDASLILRYSIGLPMPASVKTTCWSNLSKTGNEIQAIVSLNAAAGQIIREEKLSKLPVTFSGFSTSDEVLALYFDITGDNISSISISGLTNDNMAVINHESGNLFRVGIINPTGINLSNLSLLLNYINENNPGEIKISNIILNDQKYHDLNLSIAGNISVNSYDLVGAYPNPFNPSTNIVFQLPDRANIRMEIYDVKGSKVKTMMNDIKEKGRYEVVWDGKDEYGKVVSAGIYYCRMKAGSFLKTISLQLLK